MGVYRMTGRGRDIKGGRDSGMGGEYVLADREGSVSEKRNGGTTDPSGFPLPSPKYTEPEIVNV
jgi:hypothetical protein